MTATRTIVEGLVFTEGPRWHRGALWCSDMHDHRVLRIDLHDDGAGRVTWATAESVVEVADDEPSGLGWLPDGRLLVVAMETGRLLRFEPDGNLVTHADLSSHVTGSLNDMIVAADGTAYVGHMGYRIQTDSPLARRSAETWRVTPAGEVHLGADGLEAPNGHALAPDGRTLIVAESAASRLTAFTVAADGTLVDRRTFATLVPDSDGVRAAPPDGICLDAEGAAWVADPLGARVLRVREGGEVTDSVAIDGGMPVACVLGGPDRRTLLVCVAGHWARAELATRGRSGRIEALDVQVPGAGRP